MCLLCSAPAHLDCPSSAEGELMAAVDKILLQRTVL
jgi:hypothetical protein